MLFFGADVVPPCQISKEYTFIDLPAAMSGVRMAEPKLYRISRDSSGNSRTDGDYRTNGSASRSGSISVQAEPRAMVSSGSSSPVKNISTGWCRQAHQNPSLK